MLDSETFRKPRRQKPRTRNERGQEIDLETGLPFPAESFEELKNELFQNPDVRAGYEKRASEICERYLKNTSRVGFKVGEK